jgi:hypothetical protein
MRYFFVPLDPAILHRFNVQEKFPCAAPERLAKYLYVNLRLLGEHLLLIVIRYESDVVLSIHLAAPILKCIETMILKTYRAIYSC